MESFIIPPKSYNDNIPTNNSSIMRINLSKFPHLKRIEVGNSCFKYIRELIIDGLVDLESVKIGHHCFNKGIWKEYDGDGVCQITNCPNLRQLEIGYDSFEDFKSFELSNVNCLQSIKLDGYSFVSAEGFSLKGE